MKVISYRKLIELEPKPNKVKWDDFEFIWSGTNYRTEKTNFLSDYLTMSDMLEENIEIIEEDKQIEKFKINYAGDIEEKIFYEESDKPNHCIMGDAGTELLINKINEIIEEVNKLKKESDM